MGVFKKVLSAMDRSASTLSSGSGSSKRKQLSIVEWQRVQQSAVRLRNTAATYAEDHKLNPAFMRTGQKLFAESPADPVAFLCNMLKAAPSLDALGEEARAEADAEERRIAMEEELVRAAEQAKRDAEAEAAAGALAAKPKPIYIDEILADSAVRYWVESLPQVWRDKCALPYTDEEIAAAAVVCNTGAAPADGRGPKLIFQLGAAGTGKSTRMADCYEAMGVAKETMVVADGDHVREAHQGVSEALSLTKKTLLEGMAAASSPELDQYTKELADFEDDHPVGFKDSEDWCYNGSGEIKDKFANEALDAKKDVVMGITKLTHLTKKYKSVIDSAVAAGYEICAMGTFVLPEVLVTRQVGRGKRKGRLVQTHPDCKDGNLVENAALKQQLSIEALSFLSSLTKENKGTLMLFDNTPDYFADPSSKQGPFWLQTGEDITVTFDGPGTVEGMLAHIASTIQKH